MSLSLSTGKNSQGSETPSGSANDDNLDNDTIEQLMSLFVGSNDVPLNQSESVERVAEILGVDNLVNPEVVESLRQVLCRGDLPSCQGDLVERVTNIVRSSPVADDSGESFEDWSCTIKKHSKEQVKADEMNDKDYRHYAQNGFKPCCDACSQSIDMTSYQEIRVCQQCFNDYRHSGKPSSEVGTYCKQCYLLASNKRKRKKKIRHDD